EVSRLTMASPPFCGRRRCPPVLPWRSSRAVDRPEPSWHGISRRRACNNVPALSGELHRGVGRPTVRISPMVFEWRHSGVRGGTGDSRSGPCGTVMPQGTVWSAQAGEEVVLRPRGIDVRLDELVLLGGPRLLLDLPGHGEPEAVGVHLRRVGLERLVAEVEVVAALDAGGHPRALVAPPVPVSAEPVLIGRFEPGLDHGAV